MKHFFPFRLDTINQCLWRDETQVRLRPKPFALLTYLVQNAERLVTYGEILRTLWPRTFVQPEVLKSHILEIRTALGDDPKSPSFIQTLPRRGYCFIKKVTDTIGQVASMVPIIGREREMGRLQQYLHQAAGGERQVVFVIGEAGIGKTTLVDGLAQDSRGFVSGIRIGRGQCVEGYGAQEPYYPVLVALGKLLREEEELVQLFATHAPTWLVQFPALLKPEYRQTLQREILGATRQRMVRELSDVLPLISAEHTFLLILEDIHWADPATVELIAAIAYSRNPARLMLLATYRPVEVALAQHPLQTVKQGLVVHGLCHEVPVAPLGEAEVAQYLSAQSADRSVPQGLAELLHRFSEGNPLFLRAALDHLIASGDLSCGKSGWSLNVPLEEIEMEVPDSLREMLGLQIDRLTNSEDERRALEVASVCGVSFEAQVAAIAAEFDLEKYEDMCLKLSQRGQILRAADPRNLPNGYQFVHAFYRRAIYDRLPPQRRSRLHLRVGQSLEKLYCENSGKIASALALHFEAGCDWKKAAKHLQLSAANKGQRFAYREAALDLEHALELLAKLPADDSAASETEVMLMLGAIYFALDDFSRSIAISQTVARRAALNGDSLTEINVLVQMGIILGRINARQTMDVVDRLFALGEREEEPVLRCHARIGALTLRLTAIAPKEQDALQLRSELAQAGRQAAHTSGYALFQLFLSQYQDSARRMEETLPVLIEAGDIRHRAALIYLILGLAFSGNWGKALRVAQDAIATAQKNGNHNRENVLRVYQALPHIFANDWAGAHRLCEAALPVLRQPYEAMFLLQGLVLNGTALVGLGNYELASKYLAEACQHMDTQPLALEWYWRMPLQAALTDLALQRGNLEQARVEAQRFVETSLATAERTWQALSWETSARVAIAGSDLQHGQECIRKAIAVMQGFDLPLASWRVHATSMQLFPEAQEEHQRLSAAVISRLAGSLQEFPALRNAFLSSEAVRSVTLREAA